jgi:hypothetical protein
MTTNTFDPRDIPLPLSYYQRTYGASRTTFWRWEKQGLRILHVGGKRFIRPSDWVGFIEQQHANTKKD